MDCGVVAEIAPEMTSRPDFSRARNPCVVTIFGPTDEVLLFGPPDPSGAMPCKLERYGLGVIRII